ncbi:MAG: hypothetical protein JSS66_07865 [Armatimonadetes bacterium]|nr:hypothetical protein [Armatimonadota bacterium]
MPATKYKVIVEYALYTHETKTEEFTFYGNMNLDSIWQTVQNPDAAHTRVKIEGPTR